MYFVHLQLLLEIRAYLILSFFFFNDTATTEIYTLSLHDALPISPHPRATCRRRRRRSSPRSAQHRTELCARSEEHTSELQSQSNLVCRLLLEKKKKTFHLRLQICLRCRQR